jgi:prepilin-type N-terminal cleavage/methylation domain-containing protein
MSNKKNILKQKLSRGFTMIEMLVVFALIGFLTVTGLNAFFSYSQNQDYKTAISDVTYTLNFLRSRAISQAKPPICGTSPLDGYEFRYANLGKTYTTYVRCGGVYHLLETKSLPTNVSFGASTITFFKITTGTTDAVRNIPISGDGKNNTIRIETTGVVSVR